MTSVYALKNGRQEQRPITAVSM